MRGETAVRGLLRCEGAAPIGAAPLSCSRRMHWFAFESYGISRGDAEARRKEAHTLFVVLHFSCRNPVHLRASA